MCSGLEVFEAAVQFHEVMAREAVLDETRERVEERLEVWLADQCRSVAGVVQDRGHRWRVDRQGDAVHPHTVRAWMLTRDDRRPRRHAHDRLGLGVRVAVPLRGKAIDHGRARHGATVASQRVVALLIGRDEEDLATHQRSGSISRRSSSSAPAVALPMVNAIARGSQSVVYTTRHVSSPRSMTSMPPRWYVNTDAVIRY